MESSIESRPTNLSVIQLLETNMDDTVEIPNLNPPHLLENNFDRYPLPTYVIN